MISTVHKCVLQIFIHFYVYQMTQNSRTHIKFRANILHFTQHNVVFGSLKLLCPGFPCSQRQYSESLGIISHHGPLHPSFATPEARLRTFREWPPALKQQPKDLADAGFYYIGRLYYFYNKNI